MIFNDFQLLPTVFNYPIFFQFVRILWPLAPGKFKPPDQAREPALPLPDVPVRSTFSSSYQPIGKGINYMLKL
jgi:hypothetical protein